MSANPPPEIPDPVFIVKIGMPDADGGIVWSVRYGDGTTIERVRGWMIEVAQKALEVVHGQLHQLTQRQLQTFLETERAVRQAAAQAAAGGFAGFSGPEPPRAEPPPVPPLPQPDGADAPFGFEIPRDDDETKH